MIKKYYTFFGAMLISSLFFAQVNVSGTVTDDSGEALVGANVFLVDGHLSTITDDKGAFKLENITPGNDLLIVSFLGFKTIRQNIEAGTNSMEYNFKMVPDLMDLDGIVVTGTFMEKPKQEAAMAISTLSQKDIQLRAARGTADLLKAIPGTFTDASAGEVFTRVYSRGISISAEDDIGWYYVSLQEDGLPITNFHTTFYGPDLFHRVDLMTSRLEALRGGSAAITSANAPGGVFNFISKTGTDNFGGEILLGGALQGDNNNLFRIDGTLGGAIGDSGTFFQIGGFYRTDDGPRNTDFNWSKGGQLKANLVKNFERGSFKLYGKYLKDKVNRYTGLAATNWDDPQAAFGQDFNTSALMLGSLSTQITDGRTTTADNIDTYEFNPANGIQVEDLAFGAKFDYETENGWNFGVNAKFSSKSSDWQSSIANQPLGLEGLFPYLLNGIDPTFGTIPLGQIDFRDTQTGDVIASVNNFGILNVFQGLPPEFEYIQGSLPNDALMGIAPWKKLDDATEVMYQFKADKKIGKHSISMGLYGANSSVESFTSASFAYATYEPEPRMLYTTWTDFSGNIVELSDPTGISNYGGLLYRQGEADVSQLSFFLNDQWEASDALTIDAGIRYDIQGHEGRKFRAAPNFAVGGVDADTLTAYNNSVLLATGQADDFDFTYRYLSFSVGANYQLNNQSDLFARFTAGHKAPELNYYFNNFEGIPIGNKGEVQDITQIELGYKLNADKFSLFSTLFWSQLDNVAFSEFVFDQAGGGGIFFTPTQFNKTTTFGLELESVIALATGLDLRINATLQEAEATEFTIYDAAGSIDTADDQVIDYSGNELPHNPKISFEVSPSYKRGAFSSFVTWRYLGERQGNVANGFQLPAFSVFNAGIGYDITENIYLNLVANNIFDSSGLMNFFGPNEFGSNSNAATPEFVKDNPNASFVVFPIAPRTVLLRVGYKF